MGIEKILNRNFDSGLNPLVVTFLFIMALGTFFLAFQGVTVGWIYSFMFLGTIAFLSLIKQSVKDDDTLKPISNYIRNPFSKTIGLSGLMYMIGFSIPIIVRLITAIFNFSFSLISFNIPLAASQYTGQSLAAATVQSSVPWQLFNIMFVAGTAETYAFSYGIPLISVIIGLWIHRSYYGTSNKNKRFIVLATSLGISTVAFAVAHLLNASYGPREFIVAAIFLLGSNISIYVGGFLFMFWVGFHQSINLGYLAKILGTSAVATGFISWFGLFFIFIWITILYSTIKNWTKVRKEFGVVVRNIFR